MQVSYILKGNGTLSIMIDGKMKNVENTHLNYGTIIDKINREDYDGILELIDLVTSVKENLSARESQFVLEGGYIVYKGEPLNDFMSGRIIDMMAENHNLGYLEKFIDNLYQNPSYRAVNSLYEFLEHGGIPINSNGNFLVYKKVRANYMDIHSGTFDNSVGKVCSMPRFKVDENPDNTCSYGLHVCSFDYLPHFGGGFDRVVICEVNPKDVVAIPKDYNNTKMRVCEYKVIGELDDKTCDELRNKYCVTSYDSCDEYRDEDDEYRDEDFEEEISNDEEMREAMNTQREVQKEIVQAAVANMGEEIAEFNKHIECPNCGNFVCTCDMEKHIDEVIKQRDNIMDNGICSGCGNVISNCTCKTVAPKKSYFDTFTNMFKGN